MKDFNRMSVRSMTKRFGDKTAVDDFTLEVDKGEFVSFLGPSGCGKSTALNCITGLIPMTSGEISIDGECIDDAKTRIQPEKRDFGMVFQNYALFPHLSVEENVAFGLRLRHVERHEIGRQVQDALKLVHLDGYGSKFPAQMSGGEQQRVAIARCIVLKPRLLLLDEPLSNLDAKLRVELRYELKSLHESLRVSTIYVTHDQTEALALSDKIVVMRSGKIQQIGKPSQIFLDPANRFVADFVGFKNSWKAFIVGMAEAGERLEATVDVGGQKLVARLPYAAGDARRKALEEAAQNHKEVRTVIRPEDISFGAKPGANHIRCLAELVEYQGFSNQVSASLESEELPGSCRVDLRSSEAIQRGEVFEASIAPEKILLFPDLDECLDSRTPLPEACEEAVAP